MGAPLRLPERLTDGVVVLDGHRPDDAEAHWAGEDEEMRRRFEAPRRATLDEVRGAIARWTAECAAGGPRFAYAIRIGGLLAGGCELRWLQEPAAALNLSYWSFPAFRGHGHVGRAVSLAVAAARGIRAAEQVEAHIDADNRASRRVVERAGFVEAGIVADLEPGGALIERVRYVRSLR